MSTGTTAIKGQWILTWEDGVPNIVSDRWVVVEGDTIAAISSDPPADADVRIELEQALVMPGLINAHNHTVSSVMFRGLTEGLAFRSLWHRSHLRPADATLGDLAVEVLAPEQMQAVIELALLEILKGGTHHPWSSHFDRNRPAPSRRPGRWDCVSTVPPTCSPPASSTSDPMVARRTRNAERRPPISSGRWHSCSATTASTNGRIKGALAPHGADTCEPDLLREVRRLADEHGTFINIHHPPRPRPRWSCCESATR